MSKFDVTDEIAINNHIVVRWPSDVEWSTRMRARKILRRNLGRGRTETLIPEPTVADQKLYEAIAQNGTPTMTPAGAMQVLDYLGRCDVMDVRIEGDEAVVEMDLFNMQVHHRVRIPSADQVSKWRRVASRLIDLPYNMSEIRINPDAGAKLYDECGGRSEDYAGAIPGIHKDQAIRSVISHVDLEMGPRRDEDENF